MLDRLMSVLKARFGSAPALTEAPKGVEINHLGPEQTLSDMLDRGEIAAVRARAGMENVEFLHQLGALGQPDIT